MQFARARFLFTALHLLVTQPYGILTVARFLLQLATYQSSPTNEQKRRNYYY